MKDKIIFCTLLPKLYCVILFLKQKQTIHLYMTNPTLKVQTKIDRMEFLSAQFDCI